MLDRLALVERPEVERTCMTHGLIYGCGAVLLCSLLHGADSVRVNQTINLAQRCTCEFGSRGVFENYVVCYCASWGHVSGPMALRRSRQRQFSYSIFNVVEQIDKRPKVKSEELGNRCARHTRWYLMQPISGRQLRLGCICCASSLMEVRLRTDRIIHPHSKAVKSTRSLHPRYLHHGCQLWHKPFRPNGT